MSADPSDDVEISKQIRTFYIRSNKFLRLFSYCNIDVKKELFGSYYPSLYCCSLWSDYRKATHKKIYCCFLQYSQTFSWSTMEMHCMCYVCKP